MAEIAIDIFVENLKQLLLYKSDLIHGVKHEVESLYSEFILMDAFLNDCKEMLRVSEKFNGLLGEINNLTWKAENIIDTFVFDMAMSKARSTMGKVVHFLDYSTRINSAAKEINLITTRIMAYFNMFCTAILNEKMSGIQVLQGGEPSKSGSSRRRDPLVMEDNVVGFNEEVQMIIERLTDVPKQLQVISIIGMGGLGKTTLASIVYADPFVKYHFRLRAWICVSQEYNRTDVLIGILSSLFLHDQTSYMSDDRLAEELYRHLKGNRYLIVIDDVWTTEAWVDLKRFLPNCNNGSRILLTSRRVDVALHANRNSTPHFLRFLTEDESWELLCEMVFKRENCPPELEEIGRRIAVRCCGLPLAIVAVGRLLSKNDRTYDRWKEVVGSMSSYVDTDTVQVMDVLAPSYNNLPHHLKACFMYFGVFPLNFEVPVWRLLRMWIAEGFIKQLGQECLEDIAEDCLEDLADRNLILVSKRRLNGRIKTCRIHGMFRDLCFIKAAEERYFLEVNGHVQNTSSSAPEPNCYRRHYIRSQVVDYIFSKPSSPHVRSFLCFASELVQLPREYASSIIDSFKLLRVLEVQSISFSCFPIEIKRLVHLRYIAISGNFRVIPASISNLLNLQTLIVDTTHKLDIQADIWKMLQFRHLYTSGSSCLHGPIAKTRKENENPVVSRNIQTISLVSPDSCTENILLRTPNLKKLGIRGKLVTLLEENGGSSLFDNLTKLDQLETLKLLNDTFPHSPSACKLPGLPPWYRFPPNLKKLTLSDTLLDWVHMSTLGMLPNLEVLKLKDFAFKGQQWEPLDGGFRLLEVLQLGRTDLVHWEASGDHFPSLQRIVLKHCINLEAIPSGLGDVPGLKVLELYCTSSSAAHSARLIQQEQVACGKDGLKLLIYPPDF